MPDRHDPQLVDTIARAIRLELHGDNDSMGLLPAPLAAAANARYHRAARAALAAIPQPVGYRDTAPLALDKIRGRLIEWETAYPPPRPSILSNLMDDLHAILDTTQEPK